MRREGHRSKENCSSLTDTSLGFDFFLFEMPLSDFTFFVQENPTTSSLSAFLDDYDAYLSDDTPMVEM